MMTEEQKERYRELVKRSEMVGERLETVSELVTVGEWASIEEAAKKEEEAVEAALMSANEEAVAELIARQEEFLNVAEKIAEAYGAVRLEPWKS